MATPARSIRMADEHYEWLKETAATRGVDMGALIGDLIAGEQARQAGDETTSRAAPVVRQAVDVAMGARIDGLLDRIQPALDLILLEVVRGRMTAEDVLCLTYDSTNIACPWCGKPYAPQQTGPSYTEQRAAYIRDKARDILAAGATPTVRGW